MAGRVKPIPMTVILSAMNGDAIALATVVLHYRGYIRVLAMRPMKDACENERLRVDEDMRLRLEAKLIYAIITGFKILAA